MQHADQNWFVIMLEGLFVVFILGAVSMAKRDPRTPVVLEILIVVSAVVALLFRAWLTAGVLGFFFIVTGLFVQLARNGKEPYIRRIAGLTAIDEAVGRALEMGRPILMVPGIGGLGVISIQALQIFAYITKTAARYGNPIRLVCIDPLVYAMAQEIVQDAYRSEDRLANYDPDSVRCIPAQQFAFAAGVAGMIQRERVAASFLLGDWFAESLIFAESGNIVGAIQVAGSTQTTQTPFFIASCDYVIIGDEFYAGSAFLSREPVLMGSIVGQDLSKGLILASILVGVITTSFFVPQWAGRRFPDLNAYQMQRERELNVRGQLAKSTPAPGGATTDMFAYQVPGRPKPYVDKVRVEKDQVVLVATPDHHNWFKELYQTGGWDTLTKEGLHWAKDKDEHKAGGGK